MSKSVRISLATKCQLLFGAAVVLILFAALGVVSQRMNSLIEEGHETTARAIAITHIQDLIQTDTPLAGISFNEPLYLGEGMTMRLINVADHMIEHAAEETPDDGTNQVAEQAVERAAKQVDEDTGQKTVDVAAEQTAKEPTSKTLEEATEEAAEEAAEDTAEEASEEGAGQTLRQAVGETADTEKTAIFQIDIDKPNRPDTPDALGDRVASAIPPPDPEIAALISYFQTRDERREDFRFRPDADGNPAYRYVRAVRRSQFSGPIALPGSVGPAPIVPGLIDPLEIFVIIEIEAPQLARQRLLNRVYVIAAGLLACLLAIGVFWFITTRLILSPVRLLRETASQVAAGDLNIRAEVNTGDEFQQLAEVFNDMLTKLKAGADQLRGVNKGLDLKLGELAETNVALYEANKIKGEFLANVSHELRTPLNSIVGFAEVLEESLKEHAGPVDEKRNRYIANIIFSSRHLLDLINDLLDLAKIEAGKIEIRAAPMSVADTLEGISNLLKPQATKRKIDLVYRVTPGIPLVETDAGKFQQIVFNLMANAVKFTPKGGRVTLAASSVHRPIIGSESHDGQSKTAEYLRVSVSDNGPGIAPEDHERVFEKFSQLDNSVTREHSGTGLGLTISRELAGLLQGSLEVESELGRGATFILWTPIGGETVNG